MPCDAIATARAKMPVVLPAKVIVKLLQAEFPDLAIGSYHHRVIVPDAQYRRT